MLIQNTFKKCVNGRNRKTRLSFGPVFFQGARSLMVFHLIILLTIVCYSHRNRIRILFSVTDVWVKL
jgi:hypothetical protein